ncbi:MAG: hypothetical protein WA734_04570 [Candidatus Acidiferrales bacterium]
MPFGKAPGSFWVDVDAREGLAVSVVDCHAPVMMLSTPIFAEFRSFALGHAACLKRE